VPAYRRAVELRPDDPRARVNLGMCLIRLGRHDEAERELRGALAVDPGSLDARNDLGFLANTQRRPDLAVGWFRETLARDPNNVTAHMNLAVLAETIFHDPASARAHCEAVERAQPGIPAVRECLARLQPAPPPDGG
jgi:Flp pilus assembly protein TadD